MIKYTRWVDNGVYCIAHFIKENGRFLTLAEFNTKFGMTVDFLTFNSCNSSIKSVQQSVIWSMCPWSLAFELVAWRFLWHSVWK